MSPASAWTGSAMLARLTPWIAIMSLSACASLGGEPPPPPLAGTQWRLVALTGHSLATAAPMTLAFEGARAAGSDGCNRFTVPAASSGADLRFTARPATTLMACPEPQRPRADAYLRALGETRRYRIAGDGRLELLDAGGQVVAAFAAQSQALAGTQWEVGAINDGRQAVVSLVPGSRVTLVFDAQGRLSGTAGCNRYTARYEDAGGRLRIDAPAATRMACPEAGVMAQEQAFLRALEAARTARIEADRLELRDDQGALQVDATRLPPGR